MSPQPSLDRFKTLQALYVEDDPVIRESIGASLGYFFETVITAASYDEDTHLVTSFVIPVV